ncbi:DUF3761 domain-containing protein [Streptomyces mirabilis]|uniref:DUF3761 domain-containing protein n=1 Tax=Streptomyces mirabilis TaxID=68239 RepID=UPI0036890850
MLTQIRAGLTAVAVALLIPVATATTAEAATCARHTVGTCRANSSHPRGATAKCRDGKYSFSAHFRGTCSRHHGVQYWYK